MANVAQLLDQAKIEASNVRNICVLAHVDHGKTTLCDYLIATNSLFSSKMAGRLRYMDFLPDEQKRQITMKSACVSLLFKDREQEAAALQAQQAQEAQAQQEEQDKASRRQAIYQINLIDSPGHVDFSSEVSTAVRLSDGGLVLVDAVEGVCVQTRAVLEQAWRERLRVVLVINKLDRLMTQLYTPEDAYDHLCRLIENVNAIVSTFHTAEALSAANLASGEGAAAEFDDAQQWVFAPQNNNVVFASLLHGWAFSTRQFASSYASKFGMRQTDLLKVLWGSFFFNPKTKAVSRKPQSPKQQPMAVKFILEPIWKVYSYCGTPVSPWQDPNNPKQDPEALQRMIASLDLKVPARELPDEAFQSATRVQAVLSRWLPVSQAILGSTVLSLPSPADAQRQRLDALWPGSMKLAESVSDPEQLRQAEVLREAAMRCDPDSQYLLLFVTKMIDVGREGIPGLLKKHEDLLQMQRLSQSRGLSLEERMIRSQQLKAELEAAEQQQQADPQAAAAAAADAQEEQVAPPELMDQATLDDFRYLAIGRVFAGTFRPGKLAGPNDFLYVVLPPREPNGPPVVHRAPLQQLSAFRMMGVEAIPASEIRAGTLCGIGGLGRYVRNSATLCSLAWVPPFRPMVHQTAAIVRVAVQPNFMREAEHLRTALYMLCRSDPHVRVEAGRSGEFILCCAGEVHLERCVKTLRDFKAELSPGDLRISAPRISIRETVSATELPDWSLADYDAQAQHAGQEGEGEQDADDQNEGSAASPSASSEAGSPAEAAAGAESPSAAAASGSGQEDRRSAQVQASLPSGCVQFTVAAVRLPDAITELLLRSQGVLKALMAERDSRRSTLLSELQQQLYGEDAPEDQQEEVKQPEPEEEGAQEVEPVAVEDQPEQPEGEEDEAQAVADDDAAAENEDNEDSEAAPGDGDQQQDDDESDEWVTDDDDDDDEDENDQPLPARPEPVQPADGPEQRERLIRERLEQHEREQERELQAAAEGKPAAVDAVDPGEEEALAPALTVTLQHKRAFVQELCELLKTHSCAISPADLLGLWSFGPRRCGPNLLFFRPQHPLHLQSQQERRWAVPESEPLLSLLELTGLADEVRQAAPEARPQAFQSPLGPVQPRARNAVYSLLESVFQFVGERGPLCDEPLHGVALVVSDLVVRPWIGTVLSPGVQLEQMSAAPPQDQWVAPGLNQGVLRAQLITAARQGFLQALNRGSPRLVEPMYDVMLQCPQEHLSYLYVVLGRRRGRIISDDMVEGTNHFLLRAHLPIVESFGFAQDVRRMTGGHTNPQLLFSHWQLVDRDPFWQPRTAEEIELYGAMSEDELIKNNVARRLVDDIRRRKGLPVAVRLVKHADKQRNLGRNK